MTISEIADRFVALVMDAGSNGAPCPVTTGELIAMAVDNDGSAGCGPWSCLSCAIILPTVKGTGLCASCYGEGISDWLDEIGC